MCGIAGIIGAATPSDGQAMAAMTAILNHRGPDARRVAPYPGATLGHTRLSIIDLTDRALQPMESADGRHVLVFNGEIYNYKELRVELGAGHRFASDSDTEVLLAAYRRWGEDCVEHLNGMFAFCIYDVRDRRAFFARDRFGQKPLFMAEQDGRLLFASEVKALLAAGIEARPNMDVWARYLLTASYDDTEESFFAGITQLQPGECAVFDAADGGLRRRRYYWLAERVEPIDIDIPTAAERTRELMIEACHIHMRADVPVGIMLSGGLDSSAMLASLEAAGEINPAVKCFSVDFGSNLTERPWIEAAANHHGLKNRIDAFTPALFYTTIRPMMWHLEAPIGGLMNSALSVVMAAARQDGFTVLQGGTGSDEAFGGYRNHHNLYVGQLLLSGAGHAARAVADYARNWGVDEETARRAAEAELARRSTAIDGTIPLRPDLLTQRLASWPVEWTADRFRGGDPLRDALTEYLQGSKVPRNLRMLDRLSMAYGLEVRLPFLDHRLVEFGLSLPGEYLFLEGRSKGIIREALKQDMDDTVRLAVKRSIQAPQGPWLLTEPMRGYVEELIESDSFASRGFFDVGKVREAFRAFCRGGHDNSFFVWQWINVEEWFRVFIDGDAVRQRYPLCPEVAATDHPARPAVPQAAACTGTLQ